MADNKLSIVASLKTDGFKRGLNEMKSSLKQFRSSDLTAMSQGLAVVSTAFTAMGIAAVKAAADVETIETSLVSLTGGVREASKAMDELNQFTATTPFQLEGVAKAFRQLVASGSSIEDAKQQLQFLGDIAATTGSNIDEIAAIFSKVKAKGKVELKALNQLAERGVPIFRELADATGLPADKLGAGAVSVQQFEETLRSMAAQGGFAAGAMERLSLTTSGKLSTAMDNVKLAAAKVGEGLKPMADTILEATIALGQFIQQNPRMAAGLGKLIGLTAGITGLTAAVLAMSAAFATLAPVIAVVAAAVAAIAVVGGLVNSLTDAFVSYTDVQEELAEVKAGLASAITAEEAANKKLQASFSALANEYENAEEGSKRQRDLAQELTELHPSLTKFYDEETGAVTDLSAAQKSLNTALQDQLETLRKTTEAKLLSSKLAVLEAKQTKQLTSLFEDFPRLNVSDLIIDDTGDISLSQDTGIGFRFSRSEMRALRRAVKEYNLIGKAIDKVGEEIDNLPKVDEAVEFDSTAYTKDLKDLEDAYKATTAQIKLDAAEGIYSDEEILKQEKEALDTHLEGLRGLYQGYKDDVEGLLAKQQAGTLTTDEADRLEYLMDDLVPRVQTRISGLISKAGDEASQEAQKLRDELQRILDLRDEANLKSQVRSQIEVDLGIGDASALAPDIKKLYEEAVEAAFLVAKQRADGLGDEELAPLISDRNAAKDRARIALIQDYTAAMSDLEKKLIDSNSADATLFEELSDKILEANNFADDAIDAVDRLIALEEGLGNQDNVDALKAQREELSRLVGLTGDAFLNRLPAAVKGLLDSVATIDLAGLKDQFDRGIISAEAYNSLLAGGIVSDYAADVKEATAMLNSKNEAIRNAAQEWLNSNANLTEYLNNLVEVGTISQEVADQIKNSVGGTTSELDEYANTVKTFAANIGNFIGSTINQLIDGSKSFGEIMGEVIKRLVIQLVSLIATFAVLSALIPGSAAVTGGLKDFLLKGFGIPQFAEGGAVFGPTLALVGEKPGSRGEAIVPFEKIGQFVDQVGGGRATEVTVTGRISGNDISISNSRGSRGRYRTM